MRQIKTRGRTVEVAERIEELSPDQYARLVVLAYGLAAGVLTERTFTVKWLSCLIGESVDYTMLRAEHVAELDAQADAARRFLKTRADGEGLTVDFATPVNVLKKYAGHKGPGDWLSGLSFGDFIKCSTITERLGSMGDNEKARAYEEIARTLYGIGPEEEVPELLSFHAPTLFMAVCTELMSHPISINGKPIDFTIIFKTTPGEKARREDDNTGWAGILFEVAKEGPFGNLKEVEQTDMWDVLLYLYRCKFEHNNNKNSRK